MKQLKYLVLLTVSVLIGSCQTLKQDVRDISQGHLPDISHVPTNQIPGLKTASEDLIKNPCPQVEIVDDLSSLSDFTNPNSSKKADLISRIDLKSAESACKLASKSAVVDLKLVFKGNLGPKGRVSSSEKPFFSYPFFIAVTAPNGKIMAKEIFAASMTYGAKETTHTYYEKLRQIIPIRNKDLAKHYKILIGFQVTPDQLGYNRKHMVPVKKK